MIGLRPLAQISILDFDKVANFRTSPQHRTRPQSRKRSNSTADADYRLLQVRIGTNPRASIHADARAKENIGLDGHVFT